MERNATASRRMDAVEKRFERFRLSEEVLASAYERLVPVLRRSTGRSQRSCENRSRGRQQQPARRAS
jgi:hypothetical protein